MSIEFEMKLIHYILHNHGVFPNEFGQYSCPFPLHQDNTPSANVWVGERGDALFGCWSHPEKKKSWTAVELVHAFHPEITFYEAIRFTERIAVVMRNNRWQGPTIYAEHDRKVLDSNILRIRREMATSGRGTAIADFLRTRQDLTRHGVTEGFLRTHWHLTDSHPDYYGSIYIPYLDREGNDLPCAKYRPPNSKPLSVAGSRFGDVLYGLWNDYHGIRHVMLLEGESDVWAASASLQGCATLGVPTGAKRPTEGQLELLKGREGWIAFDNDEAGNLAAEQWLAKLPGFVRLELPEGTDFATGWNPANV